MSTTTTPVDNGVDIEFLRGAREALTAEPAGAKFTVAGHQHLGARHPQPDHRRRASSASARSRTGRSEFQLRRRPPRAVLRREQGRHARRDPARRAWRAASPPASRPWRRTVTSSSARCSATLEGDMDVRGILGIDSDVRNGFSNIKVTYTHRRRRLAGGHRGAGGAVAEALRRLRHHHQPHQRHRRGRLRRGRAAGSEERSACGRPRPSIIGAGHAGLAMSRCLTDRSIDHVLLERGEVASSWSTGRWDSLRLLTPNWQSRLPGHRYTGDDPDGYMTMPRGGRLPPRLRRRDRRAGARRTPR